MSEVVKKNLSEQDVFREGSLFYCRYLFLLHLKVKY